MFKQDKDKRPSIIKTSHTKPRFSKVYVPTLIWSIGHFTTQLSTILETSAEKIEDDEEDMLPDIDQGIVVVNNPVSFVGYGESCASNKRGVCCGRGRGGGH